MLLFILLVVIFLKSVILYRGLHVLPAAELKRRARNRDARASAVYKLASNQRGLDLLLVTLGGASAVALIITSSRSSWWAGSLAILAIALLLFGFSKPGTNGLLWKFTAWASPYIFKFTSSILPILNRLAGLLPGRMLNIHTGIYEKDDLLEIINKQNHQVDNRIPDQDLRIASNALTFGDKKVADIMTPRTKARFITGDESIGPMLMDELHGTGFNIFPVIKASSKPANPEIIGMLYLDDLIANPDKTKVKDIMHPGKDFIDEDQDLRSCLEKFTKSKKHLLVVANNFQEVVGVITFDTLIEQIIGKKLSEEDEE